MTQHAPSVEDTILIADDNDDHIFFLKRTLSRLGFERRTQSVGDGEQAIGFLSRKIERKEPLPALIFLDWRMPRLGGPGVLRWAREMGILSQMVVAVYTASSLPEDVHTAYNEGAHTFVRKYAPAEVVEELVNVAVRRRSGLELGEDRLPGIQRPE